MARFEFAIAACLDTDRSRFLVTTLVLLASSRTGHDLGAAQIIGGHGASVASSGMRAQRPPDVVIFSRTTWDTAIFHVLATPRSIHRTSIVWPRRASALPTRMYPLRWPSRRGSTSNARWSTRKGENAQSPVERAHFSSVRYTVASPVAVQGAQIRNAELSAGERETIVRRFLTNLAKVGAGSAGKAAGAAVGGVAGGPIGAVFGALGGTVIDDIAARYQHEPDVAAKLTEIRAKQAVSDIAGLKQLFIAAAGVVDNRTDLERVAAVVDNPDQAPDEPLLRETIERLFNKHGRATDDPETLGKAIQCNQQIIDSPNAIVIGQMSITAGGNVALYVGSAGGLAETPEQAGDTPVFQTSTSKLPAVGEHFLGRDERMADLDAAWSDGELNVLSLVADGGVGKTSLIVHWLTQFAQDGFRGAQRVFAWSFYSQGTSDNTASAELFFNEALAWFGDPNPAEGSAWSRGVRLAQLVRKHRTLLILDGLEPMQQPEKQLNGRLREQSLQALVKELAMSNPGLLLITTRLKVADLDSFQKGNAKRIDLEMLSPEACVELLQNLGVRGGEDEMKEAAGHFNHHALSIQLLGNFLAKRYDDHDIRHWKEVSMLGADEWDRNHATKVMQSYEKWFREENRRAELAYLSIIGLFNRPASDAEVDALLTDPAIATLTDALIGLTESKRLLALKRLRDAGLLLPKDDNAPGTLDAHPLVREHFGERLRTGNEDAWKAGHGRLFDYLIGPGCGKKFPDTLEEMVPLYAAIPHGCKAGRQKEARRGIFFERIRRGNEHYSWRKLGAFGSDLAALASFFDDSQTPWSRPAAGFDQRQQSWLLSEAAFSLRASGRFGDAIAATGAGLEAYHSLALAHNENHEHHWRQAASAAGNLSQLLIALGRTGDAVASAEQAVDYADRSGDEFRRLGERTELADALHQSGRVDDARRLFDVAEDMQKKRQRKFPLLYSMQGYMYCDLLLHGAECASEAEQVRSQAAKVRQRTSTTLDWARGQGTLLLDIALAHLTLGRAMLLEWLHGGEATFAQAAGQFDTAVDKLREAGQTDDLPRGLLGRAGLYRTAVENGDASSITDAERDLDEVIDIATRDAANGGTLRLFLCDAHLEYARLRLSQQKQDEARKHLETAAALVKECGYHRRDHELAALRDALDS